MKYFKDVNNEVYAYESDGSQDSWIKEGLVSITESEANSLRTQFLPLTYGQLRSAEYPDFRDYLDGVVKGDQSQIDTYIQACLAIKAKYPKPE